MVKILTKFPNLKSVKLGMAEKHWFPLEAFDRAVRKVVCHYLAAAEILEGYSKSYKEFSQEGRLKMEDVPVVDVILHPNIMEKHRRDNLHTVYESMYEKVQSRIRNSTEGADSEGDSEP